MRATILFGMICLSGGAFGTSALAQQQSDAQQQSAPFQRVDAPASDPNQIVCHTMGASSGSRIGGSRECHTQKEWDMQRQEHQRALVSQQNHALMGAPR